MSKESEVHQSMRGKKEYSSSAQPSPPTLPPLGSDASTLTLQARLPASPIIPLGHRTSLGRGKSPM